MNSSIPPIEWSELLAGYVLGNLTTAEIAMVEAYLASSTAAQQELQKLQATLSLVTETAPLMAISAAAAPANTSEIASLERLRARIVAPVAQTVSPSVARRKQQVLTWLGWGLGTVSTILAATFGWQSYQLDRQLQVALQEVQQQQDQLQQSKQQLTVAQQEVQNQQALLGQSGNKLLAIDGMEAGGKSTGSLVMSPAMDTAVLVLQNVPPLPAGKVYRMWAVVGNSEMPCGDFLPDRNGQVFKKTSLKDWEKAKTVVMTIESAKESPIPEGDAVMMGGKKIDL
jgi:flagellar motor protein MotB